MQINVHWRNWTISEKKRDQGHKADIIIKQGKKSNSFFMHLNNNKNHQIDWETTKILDNE